MAKKPKKYDPKDVVTICTQIIKDNYKEINTLKDVYNIWQEMPYNPLMKEIPSYVTFTRRIRSYLRMEKNHRITKEHLYKMASIEIDSINMVSFCSACADIECINTNDDYFFIRVKNNYVIENVAEFIKKRYPSKILATICDKNTIVIFTKDTTLKEKIEQLILKHKKRKKIGG